MKSPNSQILTVAQMQAAEQALIDAGTSVDTLMQRAGRGAAEWVWRLAAARPVTVLCGPGNNGGDGYVIAENLRQRGLAVSVVAPLAPVTEAAKTARRALKQAVLTSGKDAQGEVLVDCLFGSGLSRPLSGELHLLLRDLALRHAYRIAVDLPSGISSDDGCPLNDALPHYHVTLALGAWKFAHWLMPASKAMGLRKLVPIGVGAVKHAAQLIEQPILASPSRNMHKYTRGLCVVVAGAMPGAAVLASSAAMHGGAGYVKLHSAAAPPGAPVDLVVDQDALADHRIGAVLVGPGLGRGQTAKALLGKALAAPCPKVLDADALHSLTEGQAAQLRGSVATPHAGEMEKMCKTFALIAGDKRHRALALAQASGLVIVAKGADTLIAAPDGRCAFATDATSWLSVAGSGDVLAGITASRLASGADAFTAACEAVWLHGEAARLCPVPFTASELAGQVGQAYAACL